MVTKPALSLRVQAPTAVILLIIVAVAFWYFTYGAMLGPTGVPTLDVASGIALVAVGFLAEVLGGLIGTGCCSWQARRMEGSGPWRHRYWVKWGCAVSTNPYSYCCRMRMRKSGGRRYERLDN
jgi:hypothetical protein